MRCCLPGIDGLTDIGWPGEDPRFIDDTNEEQEKVQKSIEKPF